MNGGFISSYLISGYDNIDPSRFWVLKDGLGLQLKVHYANLWLPWGLLSLTHANLDIQAASPASFIIPLLFRQGVKNGAFPQTPPKKIRANSINSHGESHDSVDFRSRNVLRTKKKASAGSTEIPPNRSSSTDSGAHAWSGLGPQNHPNLATFTLW